MWDLNAKVLPADRFGEVNPIDILLDFEGPRIFSFVGPDGELMLAYQLSEENDVARFLLVQSNEGQVKALKDGRASLLEAIDQPRVWVLDLDAEWQPKGLW